MKNKVIQAALLLMFIVPTGLMAQENALNAFSPYTFYGVGDITVPGPVFIRSMGGTGVAYAHPRQLNLLNPASYSMVNPQSVLFNVGMEGQSYSSRTVDAKTTYSTFDIRDLGLQVPIAKGVGMGLTLTPFSSVGYRLDMLETDPTILADIGSVRYHYWGDGGISQAKLGVGVQVTKKLSLGANMIYFGGRINRTVRQDVVSVLSTDHNRSIRVRERDQFSRIGTSFGLQYELYKTDRRLLTFGTTYMPRINLRPNETREVRAIDVFDDQIDASKGKGTLYLPHMLTTGLFYKTLRFGVGLDYSFHKWQGINPSDLSNGMTYRNSHQISSGFQYTPNEGDVRRLLRRMTYRFGVRYSGYYLQMNGQNIDDKALTLGVGIPIRQGLTKVDLGLEYGQRGSTRTGTFGTRQYQMVQENYFRFSIGLSLFGEDYWFSKHKYE